METGISLFMMDESKTDNKESVIDYFLSWTLRMTSETENRNDSVCGYCRQILSILLFGNATKIDIDSLSVRSVKTWKQWRQIDLCAEIILVDKENKESKHALLIEDKAYSKLHGDQLNRYHKIFEDEYENSNFINRHYVYFTIAEKTPFEDKNLCEEANYKAFTMDEIRELIWPTEKELKLTGNDVFDEFWIKNWG